MIHKDLRHAFHQTTLPPGTLSEIGRVVVHFAILEWNLIQVIHLLLGTSRETTRTITSQMWFRSLVDLSSALVTEKLGAAAAKDYKEVLKLIDAAAAERNAISHSLWGMVSPSRDSAVRQTRFLVSRKHGITKHQRDLSPSDLTAIANSISVATFELVEFRKRTNLPTPDWI